ncbi:MAG: hypothetical protein KAR06_01805 [Deltaproteobacteria bacterium]|nr:hypothetical protein [Deltaproteobacteria bacterium]
MSDVSEKQLKDAEWTTDEWMSTWTIKVGSAYGCDKCGAMVMVTKGGVGTLEPKCCGTTMNLLKDPK